MNPSHDTNAPLHVFFKLAFDENLARAFSHACIVRDDAHLHATNAPAGFLQSPRLSSRRNYRATISPQPETPSLGRYLSSPAEYEFSSQKSGMSRWGECTSTIPKASRRNVSPPPRPPRRSSLDSHIEATRKSAYLERSLDSMLSSVDSCSSSSLQSPRKPTRTYLKDNTEDEHNAATCLKDVVIHRYNKDMRVCKYGSIRNKPRRRSSLTNSDALLSMAPPLWSEHNCSTRDPQHDQTHNNLEGILGLALQDCSLIGREVHDAAGSSDGSSQSTYVQ